ncbi:hypothetical protein CDEST_14657 [Colletotrichum destructivum]|uniref:Uncharacterized protein n=1 Tax=Colletotrichum destructivum TaxID=34406 RepID=A0AAX4J2N6_9PEZI|nr:hypothetical protein CDEST_14657 [Colletotrichum destructivum]
MWSCIRRVPYAFTLQLARLRDSASKASFRRTRSQHLSGYLEVMPVHPTRQFGPIISILRTIQRLCFRRLLSRYRKRHVHTEDAGWLGFRLLSRLLISCTTKTFHPGLVHPNKSNDSLLQGPPLALENPESLFEVSLFAWVLSKLSFASGFLALLPSCLVAVRSGMAGNTGSGTDPAASDFWAALRPLVAGLARRAAASGSVSTSLALLTSFADRSSESLSGGPVSPFCADVAVAAQLLADPRDFRLVKEPMISLLFTLLRPREANRGPDWVVIASTSLCGPGLDCLLRIQSLGTLDGMGLSDD